ncbi:MAG TPA: hypothetical protein V6D47_03285 [Oscillatoriaceae cyanobacterium]
MAKVETDATALAVETLLGGLGLRRKQELIERNDRLRMQFLQTQKVAAGKAREAQINGFLSGVVASDKKIREIFFNAWLKDNAQALGELPELPESLKREGGEEADEADVKEAAASLKKWLKTTDADLVNVYARLGPYELPAKALTAVKKPKEKAAEPTEEAPAAESSAVSDAALAELRREMSEAEAKYEAKLAAKDDELAKFKRLLEENKEKRKAELNEAQERTRADLNAKQSDFQRVEAQLRKEIAELQKARQEQADKVAKARDEIAPLRQQLERAEKEVRKAQGRTEEQQAMQTQFDEERARWEEGEAKLKERIALLESAQQQLVSREKQLQRYEKQGAALALTSADNLKIWEESLNEQEVKDAFKRTFNLDNIAVSHFEHDERDLHEVWKQLITQEQDVVERFFALPFDELAHPSDDFRELVTNFIELKDSLVAREQLAQMINFVGNRFLSNFKQKV